MRTKLVQCALLVASAIPLAGCYSHREYAYQSESAQRDTSMAQNNWQRGERPGKASTAPQSQMAQASPPRQMVNEASGAQPQSQSTSQNQVIIPLHEETAQVTKRSVPAGQVTIHKRVTTETVQQPIELRNETVTIDREPSGAAKPSPQQGSQTALNEPFQESSITIQLQKEEPVIQKNTVVNGEVVARKDAQTQQQTVQNQLRRETVQLERSGDAQNVVVNGDLGAPITEAAGAQPDQMTAMAQDPQKFLQHAYQNNQAQLQLGQLAQQKAQDQNLKKFAQDLVQKNQDMNQKLTQLAQQKGVQIPDKLDAKHQEIIDRFSSLPAATFDQQFQNQEVALNQKAVDFYQKAAQQNSDTDVKSFAQNSIAGLRQNLQTAQSQVINEAAGAQPNQGAPQSQDQPQAPQDQQQQMQQNQQQPQQPQDQQQQPTQ